MPLRPFSQVDVFTTTAFAGNPVAVVVDGDGLDTEEMRRFARWTNLSETTFVLPPTDPDADYRVRIFTPSQELPFAGHPTLGTCAAWLEAGGRARREDVVMQECAAGLVPVRRTGEGFAFAAPPLVRSGPVDEEDLGRIAVALRIDRGEIVDAQWVDNGPGWVAVLLDRAETVLALAPRFDELDVGVVAPCPPGSPEAFEVRAFFPKDGAMVEDPVTGSLNASLAQWLLASGRATAPYVARQGTALGRSGRVHVSVSTSKGARWTLPVALGKDKGVKVSRFPLAVAGDGDRAAVAYLGSTSDGNPGARKTFTGVWHLYVSYTYDRGRHWKTYDATPQSPVQVGSICTGGTSCTDDRNLLDFNDMVLDGKGRVVIGFADGCLKTRCTPADRLRKGAIIRQTTGLGLYR